MTSHLRNQKGFTLIEMAIVLIIIGIIIGAVVKGKDIIKSGEQKKFYTKFINAWQISYLTFYDRTGRILGDAYDTGGPATGQDGQADTAAGTNGGTPTDAGRTALFAGGTGYMGLNQVGLNAPTTNTTNNWQYRSTDSTGSSHLIDIAFEWSGTYNYMMINNIPAELAISLDAMIDGVADGNAGDFISGAGAAWATTPTTEIDDVRWKMQF